MIRDIKLRVLYVTEEEPTKKEESTNKPIGRASVFDLLRGMNEFNQTEVGRKCVMSKPTNKRTLRDTLLIRDP